MERVRVRDPKINKTLRRPKKMLFRREGLFGGKTSGIREEKTMTKEKDSRRQIQDRDTEHSDNSYIFIPRKKN